MAGAVVERSEAGLAECEAIIERGLATFVEVGQALLRIRDARLYRESHGTFEDYCRERWAMSRQRARQLIEASSVTTMVVTPLSSERVARELAPLKDNPEAVRAAMSTAVERHGEKPTARQVRAVVRNEPMPARYLPDVLEQGEDVRDEVVKLCSQAARIAELLDAGRPLDLRLDCDQAELVTGLQIVTKVVKRVGRKVKS